MKSLNLHSFNLNHFNNCSLFKGLPSSFKVAHYHSWALHNKKFSNDLDITSVNDSGLIMSIKHKKYNVKGVQFHPESILTEYGLSLIKNWLSD